MATEKKLKYRENDIRWTLNTLNKGNSCALVGVGSVGKSNLIRHLLTEDVRKQYLNPVDAQALQLIYIDPNNMLEALPAAMARPGSPTGPAADKELPSGWAGYEILTHRLYRHFHRYFKQMPASVSAEFSDVYQELLDGTNPLAAHIALRHFEYCLDLMVDQGARIVFLLDEFDAMLDELPVRFFRTLRGVRDDHKYNVMYATVTRKSLTDLIIEHNYDYDGLEPFVELFSDTVHYVGAFSPDDANDMAMQLADRLGNRISAAFQMQLVRVTGGHAGLLRAAFGAISDLGEGLSDDEVTNRLIRQRAIQAECNTIWLSLNPGEQAVLQALVKGDTVNPNTIEVRNLAEKQLIGPQSEWLIVTPHVFRGYLRARPA
jgi:GTPase SAR1 family protein